MLDVFVIVEGYCYLLTERVNQLEHEKLVVFFLPGAAFTFVSCFDLVFSFKGVLFWFTFVQGLSR